MRKIAIEEHFTSVGDFNQPNTSAVQKRSPVAIKYPQMSFKPGSSDVNARINDIEEVRLKEMDEAGIDMQVLCLAGPGPEIGDITLCNGIARQINDAMYKVTKDFPKRFSAFATVAPQDPKTATKELKRAVEELGLVGLKMNSNLNGRYLDEEEYWCILETAERLNVPIYLHPTTPSGDFLKPFLKYPALIGSVWGYAADCGLQAMRLICSGVFDKYPGLKIILGHLGEALPYWLWRMDNRWEKEEYHLNPKKSRLMKRPSEYVKDNFFVSTSGVLDILPFKCAHSALGPDKILFAVDYPFESSKEAVQFIDLVPISHTDKEKIYHLNAEKILSL